MAETEGHKLDRPLLRCTVAACLVLAAFLLRQSLNFYFGLDLPAFITFYPAIMLAALLFGVWPGLLATALAAVLVDYWIFPPIRSFAIANPSHVVTLALFAGMGVFMSVVAESYRRIQHRKRVEEAQIRQADLVRLSFDAIIVWRLDGAIEGWNRGAEQLYGYSENEALGHTTHELLKTVHPAPWPEIRTILRERGSWEGELRHITRDGREVTVSARHQFIVAADGIERVLETNRDITEHKQDEEALRSSQAKLEGIVGSAMDAIVSVNEQQRIVVFNRAAEAVFRCAASEAIGSTLDRFIPQPLHETHREHIRQFGRDGATARSMRSPGVLSAVRSNHEVFPIEATISQVQANGEKFYTVILRDITERKHAEDVLRQSETQFRTLADAIPQLCWMAHAGGSIFWYNERWYEYTGTTSGQMEGWGWKSVHDPEALPKVLERWSCSISTGKPFDMVFPLRGADGVFRPFLTRVMPVKDADGKVVRWFGTNTDISEQKQVEIELRKSKERLGLAVEVANLGEWELDLKGNTGSRSLRHAKIFGYTSLEQEWSYARFLEHVLPQFRDEVEEKRKLARGGGTWDLEVQIRRVDGEVRWIWVRGQCLLDGSDKPPRMFGTVMDITDRKLAEQALLRSEKLASVGRMAASIAHEINNPLAAATNALFIAKGMKDPEAMREYLEIADAELKQIAHITRQSLGFYRESNGPALMVVNEVLESAVDLLKSKISKKHANIEKQWDGNVEIIAIAGELRQVFANLLANSLDAIDEAGTIKLRVSKGRSSKNGGRCVRVTIADNGKGIAASSHAHLFEPFFTTKGTVGTGLGLWVSKQIIDKHDGSIRMRSSATGLRTGTVFSIVLPAEPEPLANQQMAATPR